VERLPEILYGGKRTVQEKGEQILEAIKNFNASNHRGGKPLYQLCCKPGDKLEEPEPASKEVEPEPASEKVESDPPDLRVDDEPLRGLGD
jgi:hypothetical protein